jgi:peroxiredoxin
MNRKTVAFLILLAAVALGAVVASKLLELSGSRPPAPPAGTATWTDFTLKTPTGEPVTLSGLVGRKPVLLAFWATWCPDCRESVPRLKEIHDGPLKDKVAIVAVDFMESRDKVAAFARENGIGYTILLDEQGQVSRAYGLVGIPTYLLIDREGKVVYHDHALPDPIEKYL